MRTAVFATFFGGNQNNTIRTAGTVYGRCRTVFKNIERRDVVRVDIGKISSGHSVDHDQRT